MAERGRLKFSAGLPYWQYLRAGSESNGSFDGCHPVVFSISTNIQIASLTRLYMYCGLAACSVPINKTSRPIEQADLPVLEISI